MGLAEHAFDLSMPSTLVVGEKLRFELRDRCADYHDTFCHTDEFTILSIELEGHLTSRDDGPYADLTPGSGEITVTARASDATLERSASRDVEIVLPDTVRPRVACSLQAEPEAVRG